MVQTKCKAEGTIELSSFEFYTGERQMKRACPKCGCTVIAHLVFTRSDKPQCKSCLYELLVLPSSWETSESDPIKDLIEDQIKAREEAFQTWKPIKEK